MLWSCSLAEVVEHTCSITSLQLGETMPNIAKDMDTHSYRIPLGVTAGICPFNFPAMIPLWVKKMINYSSMSREFSQFTIFSEQMFPMALVCGNTMVVKPSERDPGACMLLMELLNEAGVPPGVVNVIHGAHEAVDFILDDPTIRAISFVGSDQVS